MSSLDASLAGPATPLEIQQAAALGRMRAIATGLLALMAAVFVAASLGVDRWPWLAYVRAFAEAGMVGACADWFAVTALFRRPFGLPIPHTGIVPRSKDRIGAALGAFIADNFLTVEVLDAKLRQLEVARWGGAWLREPANARGLARRLVEAIPQLLELSPPQARRDLLAAVSSGVARAIPAAPTASIVLQALWSGGRAQPILEKVLEAVAGWMAEHEGLVQEQVRGRAPRWLPRWVDRKIAEKLVAALVEILRDMRDPAHPWRQELEAVVDRLAARLATDPDLKARGEEMKAQLLADPLFTAHLDQMWAGIEARLRGLKGEAAEGVIDGLAGALASMGAWLERDDDSRAVLNDWTRALAREVVAPQRHVIGRFVAGVVAGWDARSVVEKLELQVGKDLQYIRINGTLVGGLVGLAIFVAAKAAGLD